MRIRGMLGGLMLALPCWVSAMTADEPLSGPGGGFLPSPHLLIGLIRELP